jgi:hypothetical protein
MQCTAIKLNGEPCQAATLTGDTKCHFHSDAQREARREAQTKGGLSTARKIKKLIPTHLGPDAPYMKLETPADAKALIEKVCNWTLRGQIATPVSTALTNAITAFARIIEDSEIETKIRQIEERLKPAA